MNDRDFWLQVRRGLLMVVAAIETRWNFPKTSGPSSTLGQPVQPQNNEQPR